MAYIGAPLVSTNFVLDQYTATAGQTAFTMTRTPASAQSVLVAIDGVIQEPSVAYTVSGTTLTMTSGVPLNSKVWIVHLGVRGTTTTPADGSVEFASLGSTLSGAVVQSNYATLSTKTNSAAGIPADGTIPQNTEGTELITVSITPRSASNLLRVRFTGYFSNQTGGTNGLSIALFRDATANAKNAWFQNVGSGELTMAAVEHTESAGAVSATTFKLRFGANGHAGSGYAANGSASNLFGGAESCSLVVEEIKA